MCAIILGSALAEFILSAWGIELVVGEDLFDDISVEAFIFASFGATDVTA